jgi:Protein of unknown function (DUF3592)/Mu transposase, C-terminal
VVVFGVWLALAGGVALVAGLAGALRRRRLRARGLTSWAMVLPTPVEADDSGNGSAPLSVQFAVDDGRVIERRHARPMRGSAALNPGQRVLVWYDPADPGDVLVYGSDGRWSDRAFLAAGAFFVIIGVILAGAVR